MYLVGITTHKIRHLSFLKKIVIVNFIVYCYLIIFFLNIRKFDIYFFFFVNDVNLIKKHIKYIFFISVKDIQKDNFKKREHNELVFKRRIIGSFTFELIFCLIL